LTAFISADRLVSTLPPIVSMIATPSEAHKATRSWFCLHTRRPAAACIPSIGTRYFRLH